MIVFIVFFLTLHLYRYGSPLKKISHDNKLNESKTKKNSNNNKHTTLTHDNNVTNTTTTTATLSYESILYQSMVTMMEILLKYRSVNTYHDTNVLNSFYHTGAISTINHDLLNIYNKLNNIDMNINNNDSLNNSLNNKLTSYSQLCVTLIHDIEDILLHSTTKDDYTNIKMNYNDMKQQFSKSIETYNEKLAKKDQEILSLVNQMKTLEYKNQSLVKTVELLKREMEKYTINLNDSYQKVRYVNNLFNCRHATHILTVNTTIIVMRTLSSCHSYSHCQYYHHCDTYIVTESLIFSHNHHCESYIVTESLIFTQPSL